MVIDSSVLVALLLGEPETPYFVATIAAAPRRLVSAATYLETAIVMLGRSGPEAVEKFDRLLAELFVEISPFTQQQGVLAVDAFRHYGKGRGHTAGLNFGDCFSYALAKLTGEPLLFKGDDFSQTDLETVVAL
jgi:ribonuclease VapC